MDASSIAGLSTVLLAATGASLAAIATYVTSAMRKKSEVHINIKTASGANLSIEGSNISERQVKEIMRILEGPERNQAENAKVSEPTLAA